MRTVNPRCRERDEETSPCHSMHPLFIEGMLMRGLAPQQHRGERGLPLPPDYVHTCNTARSRCRGSSDAFGFLIAAIPSYRYTYRNRSGAGFAYSLFTAHENTSHTIDGPA